jgi:hypothetical protein
MTGVLLNCVCWPNSLCLPRIQNLTLDKTWEIEEKLATTSDSRIYKYIYKATSIDSKLHCFALESPKFNSPQSLKEDMANLPRGMLLDLTAAMIDNLKSMKLSAYLKACYVPLDK